MEDTGCYICIHHMVCKHFGKWAERFPYKDDGEIGPYLTGLSETLSSACAFFRKEKK